MAFIYSGFADEIDEKLSIQMDVLDTLGIKFIEARRIDGANISKISVQDAKTIKKRLDERGFRISALGSPIGKMNIVDGFDDELALFKHVLELSAIFETDYIRLFSFFIPAGEKAEKYRDEVLARMNKYVAAASGYNVTLLHENEKGIYGDNDERCLDILESIGSDKLYATFDPANFVQCGVDTIKALELLLPYVKYMHIKDALEDGKVVPAGHGKGNVGYVLQTLKNNGFDGFVSLEPHLSDFKGFSELETGGAAMEAGDNKAKFALAYNEVKKIIDALK